MKRRPKAWPPVRVARRFRCDRSGATAVEFAFVAAPFFFLMFAIIELGLLFVTDVAFEGAVGQTGRLVRTGQAHAAGMSQDQFRQDVCGRMGVFEGRCNQSLMVDVRVIPRFTGVTLPDPVDDQGQPSDSELIFNIGAAGDLILVSAWFPQTIFTPLIGQGLDRSARQPMLNATTAFRNEPFGP